MKSDGRVLPAFFVMGRDGGHFLPSDAMPDDSAKDDFAETARLFSIAHAGTMGVLIAEAWTVIAKPGHDINLTVAPSQSPERREIVLLAGESRSEQQHRLLLIDRDVKGKFIKFNKYQIPGVDGVRGRFSQFVSPDAPTEQERAIATALLRQQGIDVGHQRSVRPRFHM